MSTFIQTTRKSRRKKCNSLLKNIVLGAGTILEIAPPQRSHSKRMRFLRKSFSTQSKRHEITVAEENQDAEVLQNDWVAIENDMQVAFRIIASEVKQYVK
ncbi:hypothetical protein MNBD_PLANCTO02-1759 [hydrothermal vent metagenome]|uniref:Uncharacterized protein n=1 Tax=hydrothermal vent metagenome TaxID=652676 RepID=A0A3B1D983_9ZZZZ